MRVRSSVRIGEQGTWRQGDDTGRRKSGLIASSSIRLMAVWLFGVRRGSGLKFRVSVMTCWRDAGSGTYSSAWISDTSIAPGPAYTPNAGPKRAM